MIRSVVDFPQPEGPSKTQKLPAEQQVKAFDKWNQLVGGSKVGKK